MLVGVSLGPGDPELMTLKAEKAIKNSSKVFVSGERSKDLVENYCDPVKLEFPMTDDEDVLKKYWKKNTEIIAGEAENEKVVFANIGDINFFSTFGHIKDILNELHPEIEVKTIPGVPSFTSAFSRLEKVLNKPLSVTDNVENEKDVKLVLKARNPVFLSKKLKKDGYEDFTLLKELFNEEEEIKDDLPEETNYFSILMAEK